MCATMYLNVITYFLNKGVKVMERNYGTEIDELRRDITEIKMLLSDLKATNSETAEPKAKEIGHVKVVENVHPDNNVLKTCLNIDT